MRNPILKYLKNLFASQRILGDGVNLGALAKADSLLQGLVNEKRIPGLSITVLKDGKSVLQKGYGYADLEDKRFIDARSTIFRTASVSKPIAATALAQMVSDGIIALDASFYDYVPYYPKKKWDFTTRQLASHTAGIRSYKGKEFALNQPYSIKDSIAIFKDDPLLFEPGKGYEYNSFGWVLISLAMQEASGVPFEEYVRHKVLHPLGMTNTFTPEWHADTTAADDKSIEVGIGRDSSERFSTALELTERIVKFYTKIRSGFREAIPVNNFYKLAGGGYLSTSEDIAKFGQAFLDGTILNPDMRSEFLTSAMVNGKPTYYGLGWQVSEDKKGRPYFGHVGNSVGAYSNLFIYPRQRMVFSILINCTDPKVQEVLDMAIDRLLDYTGM